MASCISASVISDSTSDPRKPLGSARTFCSNTLSSEVSGVSCRTLSAHRFWYHRSRKSESIQVRFAACDRLSRVDDGPSGNDVNSPDHTSVDALVRNGRNRASSPSSPSSSSSSSMTSRSSRFSRDAIFDKSSSKKT